MKLFELNWCWYEEYCPSLFIHPDEKKEKEDFEKDVHYLLKKYTGEFIEQNKQEEFIHYIGLNSLLKFIEKKLPELGYVPVEPITVGFWGCYIINGKEHEQEEEKELLNIIGEENYLKIIEHNKKVSER